MSFTNETREERNYLVYKVEPGETVDEQALKMITNNSIYGMLSFNMVEKYDEQYFYIDITSKIPLSLLLDRPVRRELVLGVLENIARTTIDADDYLLNPKYFLFNYDCVYVDLSETKTGLIYLPIEREEKELDVKAFIKNMLFGLTYDTRQDCNYLARLINIINSKDTVSMNKLLEVIDDIKKRVVTVRTPGAQPPVQSQQASPNNAQNVQQTVPQNISQRPIQNNGVQQGYPQGTPQIQGVNSISITNSAANNGFANIPNAAQTEPEKKKKTGFFSSLKGKKDKNQDKEPQVNAAPMPKAEKTGKNKQQPVNQGFAIPGIPNSGSQQPAMPPVGDGAPVQAKQPQPAMAKPQANVQQKPMAIPGQAPVTPQPSVSPAPIKQQIPQPQVQQPQRPATGNNWQANSVQSAAYAQQNEAQKLNGTVFIGGSAQSGSTVFLKSAEVKGIVAVTRVKTNETVQIKNSVFKMGKEKDYVDFFIGGNPTVSRIHAQIKFENGQYTLEDINSLNHSFIGNDTTPIQSGVGYPLQNGTHFRLSDEEFVFKIT